MLNTVGMGPFSSDRSVREYAERIWNIRSVLNGDILMNGADQSDSIKEGP